MDIPAAETVHLKQNSVDAALVEGAHSIIGEIRQATASVAAVRESVVDAVANFGVSVYSANEDFSKAYRQLCSVMSVAEIKQRSAMQQLEKQTRSALHGVIIKVTIAIGLSAIAGAAIGAGITTMMMH